MAYTASQIVKTVFGNKRCHMVKVTADATSGTVDTGLDRVEFVSVAPASMSTWAAGGNSIYLNSDADNSGTTNGQLGIDGLVSGDELFVTCYGK